MPSPELTAEKALLSGERENENDEKLTVAEALISSFGVVRTEEVARLRDVTLLRSGLGRFTHKWELLGGNSLGPDTAPAAIHVYLLSTGKLPPPFGICMPTTPMRRDKPVTDCYESAVSAVSSAAARLAYFRHAGDLRDSSIVHCDLHRASSEGLEPKDELDFEEW